MKFYSPFGPCILHTEVDENSHKNLLNCLKIQGTLPKLYDFYTIKKYIAAMEAFDSVLESNPNNMIANFHKANT